MHKSTTSFFLKKISESKVQGGLVRASIIHYNLRLVEKMTTEKIMLEHEKHNREKQLFPHRNKKDNGTWDMKQEDTFENPSCNKECWNLALFFMSMFKRQQGFHTAVPESNQTSIVSVPFSYSDALSWYLAGRRSFTAMYHHASLPFRDIIASKIKSDTRSKV